jgi:antitoxin (DNA-binding transcriptional repressor) of toxin-antitoxin stability system
VSARRSSRLPAPGFRQHSLLAQPERQLAAHFYTGGIDITRLPDDVAALIEALRPGEELVITRDGLPIATISGAGAALHGEIVAPTPLQEDTEQPQAGYDDVTVVATAMKLPDAARASLSDQLGSGYIVVDMQSAPATADVLLVPPISPQLIGHLRSMFPKARIVAAEFEDDTLGISYLGAIRRMLDAGAETYLASSTIAQLARQLDRVITERYQLTAGTNSQLEIERPRNG